MLNWEQLFINLQFTNFRNNSKQHQVIDKWAVGILIN